MRVCKQAHLRRDDTRSSRSTGQVPHLQSSPLKAATLITALTWCTGTFGSKNAVMKLLFAPALHGRFALPIYAADYDNIFLGVSLSCAAAQ